MRHLDEEEVCRLLESGRAVEAFVGASPVVAGAIRWLELRRSGTQFLVTIFDAEDVGSAGFLDVYAFPAAQSPETRLLHNAADAVRFASSCGATGFVGAGLVQDEYSGFRAGEEQGR